MVKHRLGELLAFGGGHILSYPPCVKSCLVHTDETDGGEVVCKRSEVSLGVGVKSLIKKLCDNRSLYLQRTSRDISWCKDTSPHREAW